jgi:Flp pilus assembly protein TadD
LGNKLGYVRDSCKSGVTSVEVANNRPKAEQREVDTPAASGEPSNSRPPVEFITNGSSKADVRRIQGTPTSLTDAEWDYGPSSVYFSNGRVVGWRNHPDTPLKARISRPGALGLNTNNDSAHVQFGVALGNKGDWDGAIAEYREALRLNPNNDVAHTKLGVALADKGDWDGAIAEYHEALHLNPKNDVAHANLGWVLGEKGDLDGAIAEYREALLLNPKNDIAHANLAWVLRDKGDWDGAIAEYREKLRQNPNSGNAHFLLGMVLERKGNDQEALREYRAAHLLDPQNPAYREGYERLSKRLNQ